MELTGLLFYLVSVLIAGGIYAVLCLALNVQWGMGGLFNAGIAGFFAVGAYTSAIVTTAVSTGIWVVSSCPSRSGLWRP
jgi:branched-chain amino acid transport system permease protein